MLVTYGIVNEDSSQKNFSASGQSASPYDVFEIKITAIDDDFVKGTFKGKAQGDDVIEITEGKFSAPVDED